MKRGIGICALFLLMAFLAKAGHGEEAVTVSREEIVAAYAGQLAASADQNDRLGKARSDAFIDELRAEVPTIVERSLAPSYKMPCMELRDLLFKKLFMGSRVQGSADRELCLLRIEMDLCNLDVSLANASRVYWPSPEERKGLEANIHEAQGRIRELIRLHGEGRFPQELIDAQFAEDMKSVLENMLDPTDDKFKRPIDAEGMRMYFDNMDLVAEETIKKALDYERDDLRERFKKGELTPKEIDRWDVMAVTNPLLMNMLGSYTWVHPETRVSVKDRHPDFKDLQARIRKRDKEWREIQQKNNGSSDKNSIVL